MCSAWSTRHALCSLRAGSRCASARSHGELMIEGVVEFNGSTIWNHSAYVNHDEQASLTKVVLGGPYVRSHPDRHLETFGRTWALE